ncbi:MAG: rhomboid family intramembrane serine protease [Porticoccus sp.]|jgi:GlpG protein|uniref:rhomboid family intramembrane serine protease n=1 Tax=Porticoccus hydrocarbonoclasticus TaxID=1073414 RepID=UPI000C3D44D3|nr:rhomboid family intramembrane serine protease [Porticoccus hydrocarbonoclasticus]MBG58518.1 rhomboid family intramembrane serine protease [Porticoccus sp.]|tara:strand:- start:7976 stop:8839 length:864 start_codon:yes stop_codon:yes gene_type:complete
MSELDSTWTHVADIPAQLDMDDLYARLNSLGISHQLKLHGEWVQLWIEYPEQLPQVISLLEEARSTFSPAISGPPALSFQQQLQKAPVVLILLLLSVIGAALVSHAFPLVHWLTFQDYLLVGESIRFEYAEIALGRGEYWRLVTPVFLHFGIFHLAFNGLWLWELGRRIETLAGSLHMLMIVLLMAIASNLGQYLWSGPALFGGMSGVVYGLLGYIWIRNRVYPSPILSLPGGLLGFMLIWLLAGMSGFMELLMGVNIANAAHAIGLISGMVLGGWAGAIDTGGHRQ